MSSLTIPLTFGDMLKKIRLQNRIGIREHCRNIQYESGNFSKIENGVLPPPKSKDKLLKLLGDLKVSKVEKQNLINYCIAYWTIDIERRFK